MQQKSMRVERLVLQLKSMDTGVVVHGRLRGIDHAPKPDPPA